MFAKGLQCRSCGAHYSLENRYSCEACGGILEVTYNYPQAFVQQPIINPDASFDGMWKYRALLPVKDAQNIVTLGEGNTPLLDALRLSDQWRAPVRLLLKAEMLNPSGSFKDRPSSVGVSVAKERGYKKIVISSSGNASAAAAAYAARAGMECVVFVPASTDPNKVVQAQAYGARVLCVPGNFSAAYDMANVCTRRFGWANVTSTFLNPYTVEGDKTPAYELYHQLGGKAPDYVIIPIGAGPLLVGMYKGFCELLEMQLIHTLPKMIGVQVDACEPIARAFAAGSNAVQGWEHPIDTIAGGIADPLLGYANDGTLTLAVARKSGGAILSLSEAEIWQAMREVEQVIGLYCEPTGAVAVGAVKKLWEQDALEKDATIVSMLTGHGFKFSGRRAQKPPLIENADQLEQIVG